MTFEGKNKRDAVAAAAGAALLVISLLRTFVFGFALPAALLFVAMEALLVLFGLIACYRVLKGELGGFGWLSVIALLSVSGPVRSYVVQRSPVNYESLAEAVVWIVVLLYCLTRGIGMSFRRNPDGSS